MSLNDRIAELERIITIAPVRKPDNREIDIDLWQQDVRVAKHKAVVHLPRLAHEVGFCVNAIRRALRPGRKSLHINLFFRLCARFGLDPRKYYQ